MRALGRLGVALLLVTMLAISLWWFLPRDQSADPGTVDPGGQPVAEQPAEDDPAPAADPGTGDAVATAHTETGTVDDAATPAPTGPGVITGHVEDTVGERVAGASIQFELIHWSTHDWPPADPLTRSVTSDSSGAFSVSDLPLGGYGVVARADGAGYERKCGSISRSAA